MRQTSAIRVLRIMLGLLLVLGCAGQGRAERHHYGIEINGVLCGYSQIERSEAVDGEAPVTLLEQKVVTMTTFLGAAVNTELDLSYRIDPRTGWFTHHEGRLRQGELDLNLVVRVEGDEAHFVSDASAEETVVELSPDVILPNTLVFPHLVRDFSDDAVEEKTYRVLEVRENAIQEMTYTRAGRETLELAGRTWDALVLDSLNHSTGMKVKQWFDAGTGQVLKTEAPNRARSYLADRSVVKRIQVVEIDQEFVSRVDVAIADYQNITYMKVQGSIEPTGLWVTAESLNVSGQRFTGTVEDNRVEGVFEIEHPRYDGAGAPPFPTELDDEALAAYLEAEEFIESDDPVLAAKAREITRGATDAWDAAQRLSRWVAENIDYAIPGGVTARKTFDQRAGECGAHSFLLAAFCRAVDIPARVVWGCMYIPNFGGAFGQHAWNEIYMGEAGWIPVDATAFETGHVDSGHIRVGEYRSITTALHPGKMEVLDYRLAEAGSAPEPSEGSGYEAYVGEYRNVLGDNPVEVLIQDGGVVVDIPDKIMLALQDPDESGVWRSKMTDQLYCTFEEDPAGKASELQLHQLIRMHRRDVPAVEDDAAPKALRPYLGKYMFAQLQAEFTVRHEDGTLVVDDPLAGKSIRLQSPDETGGWPDEFNRNTVHFDARDDGVITAMTIDAVTRFRR